MTKQLLVGSSALLGAAAILGMPALSSGAQAAEPIKLSVGGFFKEAYMVVIDSDDELDGPPFTQAGNEQNTDGFFNDAEIHFTGSTVLDNGLEAGARVELEGETDDDQIDEAWVWFAGGFGEVRIGSDDEALANACVVPPGGTGNFSAFSPNQWGANSTKLITLSLDAEILGSNSVCTGVDRVGDAQKIIFITPNFGGFQLTASYTPSEFRESHVVGAGPHVGMTEHSSTESRHNASVYATYSYDGDDWGLTAGLGGSWEGHREQGPSTTGDVAEQDFYQAGLNLRFGNFGIGAAGEYYNDMSTISFPGGDHADLDIWVAGIGASYAIDAWTFGLQYSHRHDDEDQTGFSPGSFTIDVDRAVATVNYALGPGINIDGEIGYTWVDFDDELEKLNPGLPDHFDDYQAFEIGIGTSITF